MLAAGVRWIGNRPTGTEVSDLEGFEASEACDWSPESVCRARLSRPAGPAGFYLHQDRLDRPPRAWRHPDSFERSAEPRLPTRQPRRQLSSQRRESRGVAVRSEE